MAHSGMWWDVREYSKAAQAYMGISAHNTDPNVDQEAFHFGDPGTETGHSQDTINTNRTLTVEGGGDYAFFLRIGLRDSANSDQNLSRTYKLKYSHNSGAYTDVTASSTHVQVVADSNITDGAATTDRVASANSTFQSGEYDEGDGTCDAISWTSGSGYYTNVLFSLKVIDAQVAATDTLDFRVYESSDTALAGGYTNTPRITWNAGATEVTPTAASSAYSAPNPSLTLSTLTVTPQVPVAAYSAPNPSADLSALTMTPTAGSAAWSGANPTMTLGTLDATPAAASAAWSAPGPTVTLGTLTATPTAASASYGIGTPSASQGGGQELTPTAAVAAWAGANPDTTLGALTMTPTAATAAWGAPATALTLGPISVSIAFTTASWTVPTHSTPGAGVTPLVGRDRVGRRSTLVIYQ